MSAVKYAPQHPQDLGQKDASYVEIEISRGRLNLFERQGDGKTAALIEALARYGLRLAERVSSPCG